MATYTSVLAATLSDISDHSDTNFMYILSANGCQQQTRKKDRKNTSKHTKQQTKSVMYNVLSSLAACGRLGVAARPACLFGKRPVARDQARVARWRDASRLSQSCVSSGRRGTRLNLSVLARFS